MTAIELKEKYAKRLENLSNDFKNLSQDEKEKMSLLAVITVAEQQENYQNDNIKILYHTEVFGFGSNKIQTLNVNNIIFDEDFNQ